MNKEPKTNTATDLSNTVLAEDLLVRTDSFLREIFFENWMDGSDWNMFLIELEKQSGVSKSTLVKDLQIGLANGHSIDFQFKVAKAALLNFR